MKIETYPDRESWLSARTTGIGGSEAAAVMGLSPFQSAYELWALKTGWMKAANPISRDNADIGHMIESVAAKLFSERTALPVENLGDFVIARDDRWPWLFASHDVFTECPDRGLGVVEIKAVSGGASGQWKDGPPLYYQIQIQQEMLIANATWGAFAVVFGGPSWRFAVFQQEFHSGFAERLIRDTEEFWRLVTEQEPPDIDDSERTTQVLREKYFEEKPKTTVELGPDFRWLDRERVTLAGLLKRATKRKAGIDNMIRAAIGDAEIGLIDGRPTYKNSTAGKSRRLIRLGGADDDE